MTPADSAENLRENKMIAFAWKGQLTLIFIFKQEILRSSGIQCVREK